MKFTGFLVFTSLCILALIVNIETGSPAAPDRQAAEIVEKLWQALGGRQQWQQARYLSFHWLLESEGQVVSNYSHAWDRWSGRYRVEGTNRAGLHYVAIFNTQTRDGDVYLDGIHVTADSTRQEFLETAYGRYINDSYWFLMPYKLEDPGVNLRFEGEKLVDSLLCDVLHLTFDHVGLTPGDTYWVYIDQKDHLVRRWEYFLEGWPADREHSVSDWKDWQRFNGIMLSLNKPFSSGKTRVYFEDVVVSQQPDDDKLADTQKTF